MNKAKTLGYSLLMVAIAVITVTTVMKWHGEGCRLASVELKLASCRPLTSHELPTRTN
jgi:hypothetical protein